MKHRKRLALLLAAALSVSILASAAMAAEPDARSQATQKAETDSARDGQTQTDSRSRTGCKKEQIAEPEGAIGKDRAKELALADAGLSADQTGKVRSRVTETDGAVIYKVRFTCDGRRYSYRIDALSGEILQRETAAAEEKQARGGRRRSRSAGDGDQASEA